MALTLYATDSDLTTWAPTLTPPADVDQLLRSATFVIAKATNRNPYTDTPSDGDAPVLRDATCAQATAWVTLGVQPAAAGLDRPPVKRSALLTGSVELDTTGLAQATAAAATSLAPEAAAILQAADLLWLPVPLGAPDGDPLPHWGAAQLWSPFAEPLSGELGPLGWSWQ